MEFNVKLNNMPAKTKKPGKMYKSQIFLLNPTENIKWAAYMIINSNAAELKNLDNLSIAHMCLSIVSWNIIVIQNNARTKREFVGRNLDICVLRNLVVLIVKT